MTVGGRNRLMAWTGARSRTGPARTTCSRRPGASSRDRRGLGRSRSRGRGGSTRRDASCCRSSEGAAYFALRGGVPLVPIAINGTAGSASGGAIRVRVGEPIAADGPGEPRGGRRADGRCGRRSRRSSRRLPGPARPGRFGRWLTELFNEWPEGDRAAAERPSERGRGPRRPRRGRSGRRPERAALAYCRRPRRTGGPVGATGLSADPKEYRSAARGAAATTQIDAWAAELMRDVAIRRGHRQGRRRTSARARGSTSPNSNGCSLPAAGRPRSSGATATGRAHGPGGHPVRARARDPVAGRRRARTADRVPRRELRRARLRLTRRGRARRSRPAAGCRLVHPFPSLLDGVVRRAWPRSPARRRTWRVRHRACDDRCSSSRSGR